MVEHGEKSRCFALGKRCVGLKFVGDCRGEDGMGMFWHQFRVEEEGD